MGNPLLAYVDAWRRHDVDGVLAVLDEQCVVVEPQGAVMRGHEGVAQWLRGWLSAGGVVHEWTLTDVTVGEDVVTATWLLSCTWQGIEAEIVGRTVAHVRGGRITYLREYVESGPLGDWDGTWQD
jgi:ketosteroid isomerase-like protein